MSRRSLLHVLVSAIILLACSPAMAENRLALVIGQSAYRSVPALPNPANDAKAMTQLLTDSGFEVLAASDLSQDQLREKVSEFAGQVASKGPDTVALVFYAGHGLQIDGENYLVPVDIDVKREADIPIQAVRLNDILNTLTSVPSKMRILLLDACRNNPFPEINKTAGHGLAIIDAKTGSPGTFVSFSTSPGAEAEDGNGSDSPYTTALLTVAREPGLPIEETFKRVRLQVNRATEGRQTPWDSSSLTDDFSFLVGPAGAGVKAASGPKQVAVKRTVEEWKRDLKGKPVEVANELIVGDGTEEAYEAFVALYTQPPFGPQAREWLDRHRRMVAWNIAVITNTAAGYRVFLAQYPDSDLAATARKLEERLRNRLNITTAVLAVTGGAAGASGSTPPNPTNPTSPITNASLPGPTCPCTVTPSPLKKVDLPKLKDKDSNPPKRVDNKPPKRGRASDDDVAVYRRPPPDVYEPSGPSIGIGIGGFGGGGMGGGGFGRGGGGGMPGRRGGY
jgi:Caspase domain